jgi:hypothetical protein
VAVWDELKLVLVSLRDQEPGALMGYPMPEVDEGRHPPFAISLATWATATAERLHRQFGGNVDLTVRALPYPPGSQPPRTPAPGQRAELLDPDQIAAKLDGPAVVRSGGNASARPAAAQPHWPGAAGRDQRPGHRQRHRPGNR